MKILTISSWYPNKIDGMDVSIMFADLDIRNARYAKHWTFKTETSLEKGVPVSRLYGLSLPKINSLTVRIWTHFYLKLYERHIRQFGKPDIIHAHNYFAGYVALRLYQKHQIPYVFSEHLSGFIFGTIPVWQHGFIKHVLDNAAAIVVPGEGLRRKLQDFTQKPIDIVPNLVNTDAFHPVPSTLFDATINFVYLGNFVPLKNIDKIIEAFAALKTLIAHPIHLNIVGSGVDWGRLNQLVKDLKLQDFVTFFGQVQQPEAIKVLQKSHIFILNSTVETFGIAIVEALAMGLPVIVTRCGGPETIVNEAVGRFVEPRDTEGLVNAMRWMSDNYKTFDLQKLHDYAHQNFGKQAVVKQWAVLYNKILKAK
jgi:L-malate glycosyltransferase